jgi:hypothetical protein
MLLILVIELGLAAITQSFFVVAMFVAARHHGTLPVWLQIAQQIVAFFTNSFIGPMYATGLTLFYYDQRVRKEAYDIEWMMLQAGLVVPGAPQPPDAAAGDPPAAQTPLAPTPEDPGEAGIAAPLPEDHPTAD